MENAQPKSGYGSWIIGTMLLAYIATSFDFRHFSFGSSMVTVGSEKLGKQTMVERIRQEKALAQLSLSSAGEKNDVYWMQKIVMDAVWDQEANALGIAVSENRARDSLRQKMSFLDESGRLNLEHLRKFYSQNPGFLKFDLQASQGSTNVVFDASPYPNLFRGNSELLDPEDRFQEKNMGAFFRNNGVSLLQMVAAEQRSLKRVILKNAYARNVFLPSFYKDLNKKGMRQVRTWRSKLFPFNLENIRNESVKKEEVAAFLKNKSSHEMLRAPEMRTFSILVMAEKAGDEAGADTLKVIQDAIGSGNTLQDVAREQKGQCAVVQTSEKGQAMDFSPVVWQQPDGKVVHFSDTERAQILQRVFQGKDDVYALPLAGRTVWIQVHTIEKPRELTPKERYAAAAYGVKKDKSDRRVAVKAKNFAKKLEKSPKKSGKNSDDLGMTTQESLALDGVLSDEIMHIFQMTSAPMVTVVKTDAGYQVLQLVSIGSRDVKDGENKDLKIEDIVEQQWVHAFLSSYFSVLCKKHRISWNDKALQQWLAMGEKIQD